MQTYTTVGAVRGSCNHQHRTIDSALRCLRQDQRGCKTTGGYSDRRITYSDGKELSENDVQYLAAAEAARRPGCQ